jgi:hypothetical protein
LSVSLDGSAKDVELAAIPRSAGSSLVTLSAIAKAGWPSEDPGHLRFELVGSDGFRPSSRPKCGRLLTGAEASHVSLDVTTHDVSVDDATSLPGCFHVRAVIVVEMSR